MKTGIDLDLVESGYVNKVLIISHDPDLIYAWYGDALIVAPRNFLSTRMCSRCGAIGPRFLLSQRVFHCPACGWEADRDYNAALNLLMYGLATLKGPTGGYPGSATSVETSLAAEQPFGLVYELWVEKQEVASYLSHPPRGE